MITVDDLKRVRSAAQARAVIDDSYGGDTEQYVLSVSRSLNKLLHQDLKVSEEFVTEAIRVLSLLGSPHKPRALALEARYRHHVGDSTAALHLYKQASRLLTKQRDFTGLARLRLGLMDVYMYLGKSSQARAIGKKALAQFRRRGDRMNEAKVLTNLGNIYHRLDRNTVALSYYNKARSIFARKGGVPLAITELNRANVMANLNRLADARRLYERSADLFEEHHVDLNAAKVRYSIAYLHFLADEFTDAIALLEQLHDRLKELGDEKTAAIAHLDLAEINLEINQPGSAALLGERLVPVFDTFNMTYEQAKACYFAGAAHGQLGNRRRAADWLSRAQRIFAKEDNRLWQGMVAYRRADLALGYNRPADCLKHLQAARRHFRSSDDRRRLIDVDLLRLEALLRRNRQTEARELTRSLRRRKLVSYQQYRLHAILGRQAGSKQDHPAAVREFGAAIDVVERMIAGMYPDEVRSFFLFDKADIYLSLIDSLIALGRSKEAFNRQLTALQTLNQPVMSQRLSETHVPVKLLQTRQQLRAQLKRLAVVEPGGQRRVDSQKDFRRLEQQLWNNEQRIRSYRYPDAKDAKSALAPAWRTDRPRAETVVSFIDTPRQVGAFVSHQGQTTFVSCPIDRTELEILLRELQFVLERSVYAGGSAPQRRALDYYLSQLYRVMFAPIEDYIEGDDVTLLIDGLASQVPFWALTDCDGRHLLDRFRLRIVCNPDDLDKSTLTAPVDFNGLANSAFGVTSTHLPSIARELEYIGNLFDSIRTFDDKDATIGAAREALATSTGFVHVATHASRSTENPLFSRLLMSDGPLYPFDLFDTGIKSELVVLSGCQTAAPGLYLGNSFSLAKAFYLAGSTRVLATLWPVSDDVSLGFMGKFYSSLRVDGDVAAAYRHAIQETRDEVEHPALWAPFVLIG